MIKTCLSRLRTSLALALAVLLLVPLPAFANAAPSKERPGTAGLLIPASTGDVRIERENLAFDFVADVDTANVEATYHLANTAKSELTLDLMFVAPGSQAMTVTLDGAIVPVREVDADLPAEWAPTDRVLDPRTGEEYSLQGFVRQAPVRVWAFRVAIGAGARATVNVAYKARTGYDRDRADHVLRHTAYSLGPAKSWAGFGGLEVSVRVPAEYNLVSSPALSRRGGDAKVTEYAGVFDGVPAEMLVISTIRSPHPLVSWLGPVMYGVPALAGLLLAVVVGVVAGRVRGRVKAFLIAGTATFGLGMVVLPSLGLLLSTVEPLASASEDLTALGSYLTTLGFIAWLAIALPFAASLVAAFVAASRPCPAPVAAVVAPVQAPNEPRRI